MHTRARNGRRAAARKYAKLIRRREASQYLLQVHGIQYVPDTLAKFACEGTGPEMVYVNDIPFYRPTALDAWAKAKIGKPTTQAQKDAYRPKSLSTATGRSLPRKLRTTPTGDGVNVLAKSVEARDR